MVSEERCTFYMQSNTLSAMAHTTPTAPLKPRFCRMGQARSVRCVAYLFSSGSSSHMLDCWRLLRLRLGAACASKAWQLNDRQMIGTRTPDQPPPASSRTGLVVICHCRRHIVRASRLRTIRVPPSVEAVFDTSSTSAIGLNVVGDVIVVEACRSGYDAVA